MPRWYFTRRELRQTPSMLKGLDPEVESRYRREGARFIMELGTSMNLSLSTTMATAVVFFHRFYMSHSFQDFPRYPIACACLFLAGKVEETPKKCKDMIDSARKLLEDSMFIEQFGRDDKIRIEEIMTLERILLQTIKFDLQLEHPYKFLLKYATCLKGDKTRLEKMVQMAWNFVNDSLCTTLCLQWEPEIMAIALMHLACKLSKFDVSDWSNRTSEHLRWWDMFVEDMTMEVIEDICHQVLDFYSQTQEPVNSQEANKQLNAHSPEISQPNSIPPPQMIHGVLSPYPNQPPPGFNPNLPPPSLMAPMPSMFPTHASSPIPQINSFMAPGGPMPYFAHQPPPPMVNSPQHPLPPLPKQPMPHQPPPLPM